jgi:ribonuclease P protein component
MLAAPNRLRKAYDITRVYRRGKYGGSGRLSVKVLGTGQPESRATIVVAKKISKRAVVRNRIRRRLAGILREEWQTVRPGYDIVVTVHQDIAAEATETLRQALVEALRKTNVTTV